MRDSIKIGGINFVFDATPQNASDFDVVLSQDESVDNLLHAISPFSWAVKQLGYKFTDNKKIVQQEYKRGRPSKKMYATADIIKKANEMVK